MSDTEAERDRQHAEAMQAGWRAERATKTERGGLLIVLTGDGKGKSSSAFGMVARALGWQMRVDLVIEVTVIKRPYQAGFKPQRGVEF